MYFCCIEVNHILRYYDILNLNNTTFNWIRSVHTDHTTVSEMDNNFSHVETRFYLLMAISNYYYYADSRKNPR